MERKLINGSDSLVIAQNPVCSELKYNFVDPETIAIHSPRFEAPVMCSFDAWERFVQRYGDLRLNPLSTKNPYPYVWTGKHSFLHHFVYAQYNESNPELGLQIDHIDENKLNASISNLQAVTCFENNLKSKVAHARGYWIHKGNLRCPYYAEISSIYRPHTQSQKPAENFLGVKVGYSTATEARLGYKTGLLYLYGRILEVLDPRNYARYNVERDRLMLAVDNPDAVQERVISKINELREFKLEDRAYLFSPRIKKVLNLMS